MEQSLLTAFDNVTAQEFLHFIQDTTHRNRFRMSYERKFELIDACLNPYATTNKKLRYFAREFVVQHGQLYCRTQDLISQGLLPHRQVVLADSAFDMIVRAHLRIGHAGYHKTFAKVESTTYSITREEVKWVVDRCRNCFLNKPASTRAPFSPIEVNKTFERVQIDLIDMRHEPDGQYKWILHAKDHFSKFSYLYALKSKEAGEVAGAFGYWIMSFGPPQIVQCDNGSEFKGASRLLLQKHGIKIKNDSLQSPQTQGLVEQGNNVVERKLRAWKLEHGLTQWQQALLEVALAINTQVHPVTATTPYDVVFCLSINKTG